MSYTPQTWNDDDPDTPLSAARLDHIEAGIADVDARLTDTELGVYPLSGYGFHSASCLPEAATQASPFAPWLVRIWVPANRSITKVGLVIDQAGTVGAGGLNGFALYSDDGTVLLGQTAAQDDLWAGTDLRTATLTAPVPAQPTGRFVRVLANLAGYSATPNAVYAAPRGANGPTLNGVGAGRRRSAYTNSVSSWPATINPDTLGTPTNYLPFIVLG